MQITRKMLTEWNACADGLKWFDLHFNEDGAEYQEILNKLAEQNEVDYAKWLLSKAGAQNTIFECENIIADSFYFAGKILVTNKMQIRFSLLVGGGIEAGDDIEAGGGIKAGLGIKAGWGIEAGGDIEAGDDIEAGEYGIFAGLKIKVCDWSLKAIVSAPIKPTNLASGFFVQKNGGEK